MNPKKTACLAGFLVSLPLSPVLHAQQKYAFETINIPGSTASSMMPAPSRNSTFPAA